MTNYNFDDSKEIKSKWIKFGKVGDGVIGTLVEIRKVPSFLPGKEGELVTVYDLKVKSGSFHELDAKKNPVETATVLNQGDYYSVSGKKAIDDRMRNIAYGIVVGFKFTEEVPNKKKGFNATKVIKVYNFGPDPEYNTEIGAEEVVPA